MVCFHYYNNIVFQKIVYGSMLFRKDRQRLIQSLYKMLYQDRKQDFRFLQIIGAGGFGKVWKVLQKSTQQHYAVKVMKKTKIISRKSVKAIIKQRKILSMLYDDPNDSIINIKGAFQDKNRLYLLMQYIKGRDLRYYLNNDISLNENQIKFLIYAILKALQYLHHKKIIHRDLKPQNIIIDQYGLPHLTDFGLAEFYKKQNGSQNGGTMGYMAPEIILSQNHTNAVDYYALGVITYQLFYNKRPFQGGNPDETITQITKGQVKKLFNEKIAVSSQAIDFMSRLLQKKQRNRLGFTSISEIFQHGWLKNVSTLALNWHQLRLQQSLKQTDSFQETSSDDQEQTIISSIVQRSHIQQLFKQFDFTPSKLESSLETPGLERIQTQFSIKNYLKV